MKLKNIISGLVFGLFGLIQAQAQLLPVTSGHPEEHFRRMQLVDRRDSLVSFMMRPVQINADTTTLQARDISVNDSTVFRVQLLPLSWTQQVNSGFAYGWNDGAMISTAGYQTQLTGGISGTYGPLSFQLKPEVVMAENPSFKGFPDEHYEVVKQWYYDFYNNIDLPERQGTRSYSAFFPGQSNLLYHYKNLAAGISSENLWWGPGERNSLLMSNTAPGFLHATVRTSSPVSTPLGSFEGAFIWGRLEGTTFRPTQIRAMSEKTALFAPKSNDWRHLTGLTISYQPKFLPGLFIGFAKTSQIYSKQAKKPGKMLPFFNSYQSLQALTDDELSVPDRYSSIFFRWVMQRANAEVYFEYGTNKQDKSLADFVKNPDNGRAYIAGLRKVFKLPNREEFIQANFEVTQLGQNDVRSIRNAESWYIDPNIRHGYTHRGQMLGAGIGPGSGMQSLDVKWIRGQTQLGIQLERIVHNQDFYYYTFSGSQDFRRFWTDRVIGLNGSHGFKNFVIDLKLLSVKSLNYQWLLIERPENEFFENGIDRSNFHARLGISYIFK